MSTGGEEGRESSPTDIGFSSVGTRMVQHGFQLPGTAGVLDHSHSKTDKWGSLLAFLSCSG